jgi:PBSX family phage portal protein
MDDLESPPEFDIEILKPSPSSTGKTLDPFEVIKKDELESNLKRKVTRLQKKHQGVSHPEVKSKSKTVESNLSAYDVFNVVPPPYNLDALAKLYEKNSAHNAAVSAKATNIAGLGYEFIEAPSTRLKLEQMQRKSTKAKIQEFIDELEKEKNKLEDLFGNLNEEEEFGEIMVKVWTDVESMGNGYLEIGRTLSGSIGYIGHVPANTIRVRALRDGFIQISGNQYVFFKNYGDVETSNPLNNDPRPNELMHFKKYSPRSTYYGVPDIIPALPSVAADTFAKEYNLDYFENKAVPRYAFITKGAQLSAEAEEKLVSYFQNELKGRHHGTLYIPLPPSMPGVEVDAKFEAIEDRPQDQSFIKYIQDARLEILMAHRVPPPKAGVFENTNLAVSRDADKTFKEQVCRPEQRRIEKKLNRMFVEFSTRFLIKFKEADIIDADIKSRMHDRYLRTKVLLPNEVRREIGHPSHPDGDEFLPTKEESALKQTAEGTKPTNATPTSVSGQRKERGEAQDQGDMEDRS